MGGMSDIRIGTSGWSYDHWNTVLYEPSLAPRDRLNRYTQEFDTVELNASFYRWPRQQTFRGWRHRLPPGFRMSVKAPRGLSHGRRLFRPETWTSRLVDCWRELGERRGLLLVQLPPDQERDDGSCAYNEPRAPPHHVGENVGQPNSSGQERVCMHLRRCARPHSRAEVLP